MLPRLCVWVLCWMTWAAWAVAADSPPVRLAVIGDTDQQNLAALVMVELSHDPAIHLVERDDLARAGDERRLQQLAGSDAAALGKLLGADGLVFIGKGAAGPEVRLTAVGLGYALFDDELSSATPTAALAPPLARRIAGYILKLKLDPAKAISISVLNLRADYATPASTVLERKLTLLLESRLSALPEFVVLERRHGGALGFERAMAAAPPSLLHGAYVVDGGLSLPMGNSAAGELTVSLRVRAPDGRQTPQEIRGRTDDLPALVERLAAAIRATTGTTADTPREWQPEKEAREYLEEGLWGWQHGANTAAMEALDTAELLGEKAPDLVAARIAVLSARVYQWLKPPDDTRGGFKPMDPAVADAMIDDTLRAMADAVRYDAEKMQPHLQLLTWQRYLDVRPDQIKENLTNLTSDILVSLDDQHSPRADELRQALRAVTGYDPLHGKLGRADQSVPLYVTTRPDVHWDFTLEEELAYYGLLGTVPHQFIPPELLTNGGKGFCSRFLKTPPEQTTAYKQFLQKLRNDPDGRLTYQLILSCSTDGAVADAAYTAYWQEMWKRREGLVSQRVQVEEWTSARPVPGALRRKHASEMVPLLRYYLTHVNNYRDWEYFWETTWQPSQWSEADAAAIWADYLGYKQRVNADQAARGYRQQELSTIEEPFRARFPQLARMALPTPTREPLVVTRLWHPWSVPGTPPVPVRTNPGQAPADAIWLTAEFLDDERMKDGLRPTHFFAVHLPGFETRRIDLPGPMLVREWTVGARALYVAYTPIPAEQDEAGYQLARFDLQTRTWATRDARLKCNRFYTVGDVLYLDLGSGIARYDWATGQQVLLASSRRKPAQNQFDDCAEYFVDGIFTGPGGAPCLTADDGTFYIQEHPGNWPPVCASSYATRPVTYGNKTLLCSNQGQVILVDPAQAEPTYLMMPPASSNRPAPVNSAPWQAEENISWNDNVGGDSQRLFALKQTGSELKLYELLWYDQTHGPKAHHIPLRFVLDEQTRAALAPVFDRGKQDQSTLKNLAQPGLASNLSVIAAQEGVYLSSENVGIWFIPYRDITDYLQTHASEEPDAAPHEVTPAVIPPPEEDAESQVIGDMIDPAIRDRSFR